MAKETVPQHVAAIKQEIKRFLDTRDAQGRAIGNAKFGIYAFYDYDGEPIYVGQTSESLRARIGRHLTNQRTDAVAMNVLDPFEVAEIEVWPLDVIGTKDQNAEGLAAAEYAVFEKVIAASTLGAVLNEKDIPEKPEIDLPRSYRGRIVPDTVYALQKHPDTRIARRAGTIANLARVISERDVSKGLRRTLVTQAQRLERLASLRLAEFSAEYPDEVPGEETGEQEI